MQLLFYFHWVSDQLPHHLQLFPFPCFPWQPFLQFPVGLGILVLTSPIKLFFPLFLINVKISSLILIIFGYFPVDFDYNKRFVRWFHLYQMAFPLILLILNDLLIGIAYIKQFFLLILIILDILPLILIVFGYFPVDFEYNKRFARWFYIRWVFPFILLILNDLPIGIAYFKQFPLWF